MSNRSGKCLCGEVTYAIPDSATEVLQCHCENCRRLSGNFVAATRVPTTDLHIEDQAERLGWYDLGYARYGFCRGCGATLFYQAADRREITSVMVGTLDDASGLSLGGVWFTAEAQPHNSLPEGVPHHTGNAAGNA